MRAMRPQPANAPSPHREIVWATTDVAKGGRFVRKGQTLRRDDPMVRELPSAFEMRIPLKEVTDRG